jgi:hypothetical protein
MKSAPRYASSIALSAAALVPALKRKIELFFPPAASGRKQPVARLYTQRLVLTQSRRSLRLIDMPIRASVMINRFIIFVSILAAFSSSEATACSCMSKGNFVEYANQSEGVIRAKIVGYGNQLSHGNSLFESMSVEVIAVVKGNLQFESIVLLGDPGHLCRDYVDSRNFVIGEEYLIALHGDEAVQPFGGCGEAWLKIRDDVAVGYVWTDGEPQKYSVSLQDLLNSIESK